MTVLRGHGLRRCVAALVLSAMPTAWAAPASPTPGRAGIWYVSKSPKVRVDIAAGCPPSTKGYADVVNTFAGPPLVPSGPSAGLICWYGPIPNMGQLARQTRLDARQANVVVAAVRKLDLNAPAGTAFQCPTDLGLVALIGMSYPGRTDVGLWYAASGCQSVDNGRIGSFGDGNATFDGFGHAIDELSPPPGRSGVYHRGRDEPRPGGARIAQTFV